MSNWRIPLHKQLPLIPKTGQIPPSLITYANLLRKESHRTMEQDDWLITLERRLGVTTAGRIVDVPYQAAPTQIAAQGAAISGREALSEAVASSAKRRPVARPAPAPPPPDDSEEEEEDNPEVDANLFEGVASADLPDNPSPPIATGAGPANGAGGRPPLPPRPGSPYSNGDGGDLPPRRREPPPYDYRQPPQLPMMPPPTRPFPPPPPMQGRDEEDEEDNEEQEDEEDNRELVIDSRHLNMLMTKNENLVAQILQGVGENARLSRQAADDARRNADAAVAACARLAEIGAKQSVTAMENGAKLAQAAIGILTAAADATKSTITAMDNRMRQADEARQESMAMMERGLTEMGRARAIMDGAGVPAAPSEEADANTQMMGSLLGAAGAQIVPVLLEKLKGFMTPSKPMPEAALADIVAKAVAEALAKAAVK